MAMLAFSCSILLATLASILRSLAALELENLPCGLGGQFKSGQLGSDQNRTTEVARNC